MPSLIIRVCFLTIIIIFLFSNVRIVFFLTWYALSFIDHWRFILPIRLFLIIRFMYFSFIPIIANFWAFYITIIILPIVVWTFPCNFVIDFDADYNPIPFFLIHFLFILSFIIAAIIIFLYHFHIITWVTEL